MRTLLLALTIGFAAVPVSAQSVKAGIEAWQKGNAAEAVKIWQPLAEKGDADAAFNLGQAYRLGKGVPLAVVPLPIGMNSRLPAFTVATAS